MKFQFTNRASTHLAAPLGTGGTFITVAPGTGDRFPSATVSAPAQLTIISTTGASEIVQCHNRAGDVLDILRAQEGSSVSAFAEGSLVELRLTAEVLNSFLPLGGGQMAGDLDMAGHAISNTNLFGGPTIDVVKTNAVMPGDGNAAASIQMLNGGIIPRIDNNSILTTIMLHAAVFLWWGRIDQLPPWLKLCDGTAGTPDLRGRFPLGAADDNDLGIFGGEFDVSTGPAGGHNHANSNVGLGVTGEQTLHAGNLPGLTAPTLNVTRLKLLDQALGASQPTQPARDFVQNVTMAGGGTYSGGANHAHAISYDGIHGHSVSIRPPYFKLHYVMFRSMQIN
jgi:hypothetical protein